MTIGRSLVAAAMLAVAVTGCSTGPEAISLIDLYPGAEKRAAFDLTQAFTVTDATVAGVSRRVILAHAASRITWSVSLPRAASLRTWIALRPDAWERDGDGVVFRVEYRVDKSNDPIFDDHNSDETVAGPTGQTDLINVVNVQLLWTPATGQN